MPNCCAYNCKSKRIKAGTAPAETPSGHKVTFHKFPFSKPNLVKRWVWETRLKNFKPKKQHVLCSVHFEEKHFDRTGQTTRLREGAIPTIFDFPDHMKKVDKPRRSKYKRPKPEPDEAASMAAAAVPVSEAVLSQSPLLADPANQIVYIFDSQGSGTIDILSAAAAVIDAVDTEIYIDPAALGPLPGATPSQSLPPDATFCSGLPQFTPSNVLPLLVPASDLPPPTSPDALLPPPPLPTALTPDTPYPITLVASRGRGRGRGRPYKSLRGRPSSLSSARLKSAIIPPFLQSVATQTAMVSGPRVWPARSVATQTQEPPLSSALASLQDHSCLIQSGHHSCLLPSEHHYQEGMAKLQRKLQHEKDKNFQVRKRLRMSQQRMRRLAKRIGTLKGKVRAMTQEKLAYSDVAGLLETKLSGAPLEIMSRIVSNRDRERQNKRTFAPELRTFAMKLHACSSKAYGYVRETFERVLPHPSVVRAWSGHAGGVTGFSKEEVQALEAVELSFEPEPDSQMMNVLEIEQGAENQMAADLLTHAFFVDIGGNTAEYNIVTVAAEELV